MACLTVPSEFRRVQNEFPILFRRDLDSGRFSALALFGFENGENLFLEDGALGRALPPAGAVDPAVPGRPRGGRRRRSGAGSHRPRPRRASPATARRACARSTSTAADALSRKHDRGLDELDQGYRERRLFAALERYELLEPFSLDVELRDGSKHRLVGYHLIDEEKLRCARTGAFGRASFGRISDADLHGAGLARNLSALVERKNRKARPWLTRARRRSLRCDPCRRSRSRRRARRAAQAGATRRSSCAG
jgi:hypothetical protein